MKLEILLKNITPLPWDARGTFAKDEPQLSDNRRYAAHAANVLPELVKAASKAYPFIGSLQGGDAVRKKLNAAIARAEEVKMSDD